MRFTLSFAVLCVSGVTLAATFNNPTRATPIARGNTGLNPPRSVLVEYLNERSAAAPRTAKLTNAELLRRGLPPHAPARRRLNARPATRSALPGVTACGYIRATYSQNGTSIGYLSSQLNEFGEVAFVQADQSGAQKFDLTYYPDSPNAPVNLKMRNPVAAESYLGGVVGYDTATDDIGYGSTDYSVLAPTGLTMAHSPPVYGPNAFNDATGNDNKIESAIWRYNAIYNTLGVQWINTDGSEPTTHIAYVIEEPMFVLSGDVNAFYENYGLGASVYFTFVHA
ncbi:hypothetical protein B0H15DRAFT_832008 [Mycena belliarum]|uniref:Uncharacterized protein n=1 Tax=Mycena belliarum TaxID=1033014 RepID=A0AAD6XWN6_9AGAR|nr:hypothetical protein B0H15DRAFT_832008 [Mycena belliae]